LFAYTLTLLNACNNELYYALTHHTKTYLTGYGTLDAIIATIKPYVSNQSVYCIGEGANMHKEDIERITDITLHIPEQVPLHCSLNIIAQCALEKYTAQDYGTYLFPLHLKKHAVER